ncbi:MAG: hypothetical protein IJP74_08785 [Prevotella sp.]|nr:hypothetical protein [Prevotella sp.]
MKEEEYLIQTAGRSNAFRVPDGYFDTLTQRVMEQLPAEEPKAKVIRPVFTARLKAMVAAAACVAAVVFGGVLLFNNTEHHDQLSAMAHSETVEESDYYFDEAADYAMMDNHDIYACLMSE